MSTSPDVKYNVPTALAIFGGTGDLAQSKLLPAVFDLYTQQVLPDRFVIIGFSRQVKTNEEYQAFVKQSLLAHDAGLEANVLEDFCAHIEYVAGDFTDQQAYEKLKTVLTAYDERIGQCTNKLFYLAVPPQLYADIFEHIHATEALTLCDGKDAWARLLVEKPFGNDLATAQALEEKLCALFADEQIYRIDHYLAKDAIENIISLRFANSIIADVWNNHSIESISINLFETKDVATRGAFYDAIGSLRDVGQNHILQIFALLTMPAADIHDAQSVRAARATALETLRDQTVDTVVRGQYVGYQDTHGVRPGSQTETYFHISFMGQTGPWQNTRFTLAAGKALANTCSEAVITFRPHDLAACGITAAPDDHKNILRIEFTPEEKISLTMSTKQPGYQFALQNEELLLLQAPAEVEDSPEAYERVLYDCIAGDQTRFVSGREVEAAWHFITPILETFKDVPLRQYQPGSTGPAEISK